MPSCVVKSCKNHSGTIKKSKGITFHRFPKSNDTWKNDWVQIIRESRKEIGWLPSKSSVVCSTHFEESDLYTTKGGLLRVVTYAIPQKCLNETSRHLQSNKTRTSSATYEDPLETSKIKTEKLAKANSSSASDEIPLEPSNIKIEDEAEENTPSALHEDPLEASDIKIEHFSEESSSIALDEIPLEPSNIKIQELSEASTFSALDEVPLDASNIKKKDLAKANTSGASHESVIIFGESLQGLTLNHPYRVLLNGYQIELRTSLSHESSKESSEIVTSPHGLELEQPLSVLYTPKRGSMEARLLKMHTLMLSHKKKIKTLNQKIRRLQNRNKYLKDIIRRRKELR